MNLKKAFFSSSFWTGVGRYLQYGVQLAVMAVLARLLEPEAFGILAMVVVFNGFALILTEAGISSTVIQKRDLKDKDLSTVFWFSCIVATVIAVILVLSAPLIEWFYDYPGLSVVVQVLSISLLVNGLSAVPNGILRRDLKFKQLAIADIVSALLSGLIAILLAYYGFGYWALIFQIIIQSITRLLILFVYSKWIPKFIFRRKILMEVLSYSNYVVGFQSINYWARNGDNLLIGKVLGADALGFYSVAYKLMMIPYQGITGIINPSLHPILSTIQNDKERIRKAYFKVIDIIGIVSIMVSAYMFYYSKEIIELIYGPNWGESIEVFAFLAIVSAIQPITATTGPVLLASNRADLYFKTGIFSSILYVIGFFATVQYGIEMVAIGYIITNLLVSPVVFQVTYGKVLQGKSKDIWYLYFKLGSMFILNYLILKGVNVFSNELSDLIRLLIGVASVIFINYPFYYKHLKNLKIKL